MGNVDYSVKKFHNSKTQTNQVFHKFPKTKKYQSRVFCVLCKSFYICYSTDFRFLSSSAFSSVELILVCPEGVICVIDKDGLVDGVDRGVITGDGLVLKDFGESAIVDGRFE